MEGRNKAPYDIENPCIPLVASMRHELDGLLPLSASCCIYRVPEELRCANEKAYTPQVVSIGPLHHGKKGLEAMEEHKKRYLQSFLDRTGVSLENYVKKIKGKEAELRSCYADSIGLHSDEFVRIILVDAVFIIELLLKMRGLVVPDINDRILNKPWLIKSIGPDMLLLENQLPFFILEDLLATAKVPATMPSVFDLSYNFCNKARSLYLKREDLGPSSSFEVKHFVDLIRTLYLPMEKENSENQVETLGVPSLTKLHQAGVKFKARSGKNLFHIRFKDGILEIPNLIIEDCTELLLRNLIAFEQCHCIPGTHYFSDYIILIDYFVNSPNDVELLVKNGIVENMLGDNNEVSTLINSLGKGVMLNTRGSYYATLTKGLHYYCEKNTLTLWKKWKANWTSTWKAKLKQNCFDTPWRTISVIAATLIIILTFIQTVCSFSQCAQR